METDSETTGRVGCENPVAVDESEKSGAVLTDDRRVVSDLIGAVVAGEKTARAGAKNPVRTDKVRPFLSRRKIDAKLPVQKRLLPDRRAA